MHRTKLNIVKSLNKLHGLLNSLFQFFTVSSWMVKVATRAKQVFSTSEPGPCGSLVFNLLELESPTGDKIKIKNCTCPAGHVTYNFHSSCKHMHLSFKSVCNKEHKEVICNITSSSNSFQSTRPTGRVLGKNYSSFLDFTSNYERTSGIFVPCPKLKLWHTVKTLYGSISSVSVLVAKTKLIFRERSIIFLGKILPVTPQYIQWTILT